MIVLWDLDGTLSDHSKHIHLIQGLEFTRDLYPDKWKEWDDNLINHNVVSENFVLYNLFYSRGWDNYIITARNELSRKQTEDWLTINRMHYKHKGLFMRKQFDKRTDAEIKLDILKELRNKGIEPNMAFDDKDCVVNMYRTNGVKCFQVT